MSFSGIRPINLKTDLAQLADLIEIVFAPSLDEGGRAAIREMRYLSKLGAGLTLLGRFNEIVMGVKLGYVWEEAGQVIGNVSLYPAFMPAERDVWIIANVGVHPDYQGRGIARKLMHAALDALRERHARAAILQVDYDNYKAIHLYDSLYFYRERAWTTWRRSSLAPNPPALERTVFITRRRPSEWRAEYALAQQVFPKERGGLGWLRPLSPDLFRRSLWRELTSWLTMNNVERLIVRSEDEKQILASLWVENALGTLTTRLTLLHHPHHPELVEPLLNTVVRRFRTGSLMIEHPFDDALTSKTLRLYRFMPERTVWHMRWENDTR